MNESIKRGKLMADNNHLIHLDDENFQQTIAQGVTLVDFFAAWCGPCRMIAPLIEELSNKVHGQAKVAKLDIDQSQQIAANLQIVSIPTLILFKDGNEVKRVVGAQNLETLHQLIQSALA